MRVLLKWDKTIWNVLGRFYDSYSIENEQGERMTVTAEEVIFINEN